MRLANIALILGLSLGLWGCSKDTTTATTPPTVPSASADASASSAGGGAAASTSRDTSASSTKQGTTEQAADRSTSADRPEGAGAKSASTETSITGCLAKGETADNYLLTEEKTEAKTTVQGSADLAKHVSHKVTLFGTKSEGAHPIFKVTRIQHVAATCTAP